MGKFGWSYPAGCDGVPDDDDYGCDACGLSCDDCTCEGEPAMNPDTSYISFPAFDEIAECVNVEPVDKIRSLLLEVMDNAAAASMRRNTLSDSIAVRDFIARSAVEKMRRHGLIK